MRKTILLCAGCLTLAAFAFAAATETKVLFDFEVDADAAAWRAARCEKSVSAEHATSGAKSLKLKLTANGDTSGIATEGLAVKDWSGYTTFAFDVFADDGLALTVSLRDAFRKPFRKEVDLAKGANTISIPVADIAAGMEDAKLDIKKMAAITLLVHLGAERTIYIDNVRLEK